MRKKNCKNSVYAFPTSYAQKRIWFLEKLDAGRCHFNIGGISRFRGSINFADVEKIFQIIFSRHDVCRMNFFETKDGDLVQVLSEGRRVEFQIFDLQNFVGDKDSEVEKIAQTEKNYSFDLEKDQLIRFSFIRLQADEQVLVVVAHHLIVDAWSLSIAANEFFYFAQAMFFNKPLALPAPATNYQDYAAWEQSAEFFTAISGQEKYWLKQLGGELPILNLPNDYPRPRVQHYDTKNVLETIDKNIAAKINQYCGENNVTTYAFFLAVFNVFLYKLTNQSDLIVGTFAAKRDLPELDNVMGLFLNNLAIRSQINSQENFSAYLKNLQETILGAMENKDYPFEKLIEKLNPPRDLSRAPIFNVVIQMFNSGGHQDLQKNIFYDYTQEYQTFDQSLGQFDLSLHAHDLGGEFLLALMYNSSLFNETSAKKFIEFFSILLTHILDNPSLDMVDLPEYFIAKSEKISTKKPEAILSTFQKESAPVGKTEKLIAKSWQELLGVNKIDRHDDFFLLGGHSFAALRLVNGLRKYGFDLTLMDVFNHSILCDLAVCLDKKPTRKRAFVGGIPLTVIGDYLLQAQRGLNLPAAQLILTTKNFDEKLFLSSLKKLQKEYSDLRIGGIFSLDENLDDGYALQIKVQRREQEYSIFIIRDIEKINSDEFAKILLNWQKQYNLLLANNAQLEYTPFCSYPEYYHCVHANVLEMTYYQTNRFIYRSLPPAYDYFLLPNYCRINARERRDNDFNALLLGRPTLFSAAEKFGLKFDLKKINREGQAKKFWQEKVSAPILLMGNNYFLPASPYYHQEKFIDSLLTGRNLLPMNFSIFQKQKEQINVSSVNLNYFGEISYDDFWNYWKNFKDFGLTDDKTLDFSFQYLQIENFDQIPNFGLADLYEALAMNIDEFFLEQVVVGGNNSGFDKIFFGSQVWDEFSQDIKNNLSEQKDAIADIVIVDMLKRLQKPNLFLKDLLSDIVVLNDDFVIELDNLGQLLLRGDQAFASLYKKAKAAKIDYEPIMTLLPSAAAQEVKFLTTQDKEELIKTIIIIQKEQKEIFKSLQSKLKKII